MRCSNCGKETSRLIIDKRGKACANCRGLSEVGGVKLGNILTRSSERIRAQQQVFEGDLITPHVFDKATGQVIPNPDFVDRFANELPSYFTRQELERAGYSKAQKIFDRKESQGQALEVERAQVEYATEDADTKIAEVIESA